MADGHFKIAAIIQARIGSSRLPNKVLMPLPANSGHTILSRIIVAIKGVKPIDRIFVATSIDPKNNPIEECCIDFEVDCYRGSEDDVLSRFYDIVNNNDFDFVLRFTADNPVIDEDYLNLFIKNHIDKDLDYSYSQGLPLGCNFEMIRAKAIIEAHNGETQKFDREHVTPFIKRNSENKNIHDFNLPKNLSDLRFTIDYPTDYALFNLMYNLLGTKDRHSLLDFINLMGKYPWLKSINNNSLQKQKAESLKEEIKIILPISKNLELNRLTKFLNDAQEKKNNL